MFFVVRGVHGVPHMYNVYISIHAHIYIIRCIYTNIYIHINIYTYKQYTYIQYTYIQYIHVKNTHAHFCLIKHTHFFNAQLIEVGGWGPTGPLAKLLEISWPMEKPAIESTQYPRIGRPQWHDPYPGATWNMRCSTGSAAKTSVFFYFCWGDFLSIAELPSWDRYWKFTLVLTWAGPFSITQVIANWPCPAKNFR